MTRVRSVMSTDIEYALFPNGLPVLLGRESEATDVHKLLSFFPGGIKDFWIDGSRRYQDVGEHPEFAAAENEGPFGTALREFAGDLHMFWASRRMSREYCRQGKKIEARVFKHSADFGKESWGCHLNFSASRHLPFSMIETGESAPLAALAALTGGGDILWSSDSKPIFVISQRARFFFHTSSGNTTGEGKRGMISTRDEPYADGDKIRRVHIICLDHSLCRFSVIVRAGFCAIVLRILEEGGDLPIFPWAKLDADKRIDEKDKKLMDYAVWLMRRFAEDPTLRHGWPAPGGDVSAIDILERYVDPFRRYCFRNIEGWEKRWFGFFMRYLDLHKRYRDTQNLKLLAGVDDWATKLSMILADMREKGYDWDDDGRRVLYTRREKETEGPITVRSRMDSFNLSYHLLHPEKGFFFRWKRIGGKEPCPAVFGAKDLLRAMRFPPAAKRGWWRRRVIMLAIRLFEPARESFAELVQGEGDGAIDRIVKEALEYIVSKPDWASFFFMYDCNKKISNLDIFRPFLLPEEIKFFESGFPGFIDEARRFLEEKRLRKDP